MNILKSVGSFFIDIIETIVIALAIFVVVYLFLLQPHQVRGHSMDSSFSDGEYILTDKISYRFGKPERGDVVVFKAPKNQDYDYIKRIIGLPEERVKVSKGSVYIYNDKNPSGVKLEEPYLDKGTITVEGAWAKEDKEITVKPDQYFVLGDNRSHSSDSREWGLVPKENIIGRAWLRYWPINEMAFIPQVDFRF
ncbi:MAG: signal peptidase I [Patescibacteria group bacterium]|nr:signal peptidase I [Patescibacteria group bacterium]